ncbi:MAG: 1,2-diacylglycerol 3-alpha-glucosyltransferase [Pseudomonadota bacterium]|nr:1,2-diacylglycerol 3-alpha-glucosyltransferase [Pseudomonadota bacterium]
MNILMVSDVYFPRINGVSTSIQTFREELQQLGHKVILIAPEYPHRPSVNETGIYRISSRAVWGDPEDRMMKMGVAMELLDELREQRFDLVHIQTPFVAHYLGLRIAKKLRLPTVVSYHTFFEEYLFHYFPFAPKEFMRYIARRFSRSQCNQVSRLVVPSTAMKQVLENYGVTQRMDIIPTGLKLNAEFPGAEKVSVFRNSLGIDRNRPCLVHVGRIAFEKNIEFLLQVIQRVKQDVSDLAVIIAGEGPALAGIKDQVCQLGLSSNVYFTGYLDRKTILPVCYAAGDVFIFSSRTETQGLVLLEAMAMGVPVVSTAVMGTKDILHPQLGALIAEENVEDFSAKVIRLLSDKTLRSRLSQEARDYVYQWTDIEMALRMERFYETMLQQSSAENLDVATEETC